MFLLWNVSTGRLKLQQHQDSITALAFSPDGALLATGSRDHTVRLWNLPARSLQHILWGHRCPVRTVAFSPDGKTLASAGGCDSGHARPDNVIRLWDVPSSKLAATLKGHAAKVAQLIFSSDGSTLVSASQAADYAYMGDGPELPEERPVRTWRRAAGGRWRPAGSLRLRLDAGNTINQVFLSRNTTVVWVATTGETVRWQLDTGHQRVQPNAFSVFETDGQTKILHTENGIELRRVADNTLLHRFDGTLGAPLRWSPDRSWLVTDSDYLLDLRRGRVAAQIKAPGMTTAAFSVDGQMLATGTTDGTVRLWRLPTAAHRSHSALTSADCTVELEIMASAHTGIRRLRCACEGV